MNTYLFRSLRFFRKPNSQGLVDVDIDINGESILKGYMELDISKVRSLVEKLIKFDMKKVSEIVFPFSYCAHF